MDPIVNMFPAVLGEELYWRVNRRFATTAPLGKNARRDPKSIVAGIMRCATCGRLVTRVTNKLSKNAEVTARELWIYDPWLCEPLSQALIRVMDEEVNANP
jgi:hypothetical protein